MNVGSLWLLYHHGIFLHENMPSMLFYWPKHRGAEHQGNLDSTTRFTVTLIWQQGTSCLSWYSTYVYRLYFLFSMNGLSHSSATSPYGSVVPPILLDMDILMLPFPDTSTYGRAPPQYIYLTLFALVPQLVLCITCIVIQSHPSGLPA